MTPLWHEGGRLLAKAPSGDTEVMIAVINGIFNMVCIGISIYLTKITSRLDKEVRNGGK